MSSDREHAGTVALAPQGTRTAAGYRFTGIVIVLVLAVIAAGLAVVAVERGPRLRFVSGETAQLVERPGATLSLHLDQPVSERSLDGFAIEPAVPVDVSLSGSTIQLRFPDMLDYATEYRVTAPSLRGLRTGREADLTHVFSTPPFEVFTLQRNGPFGADSASDSDAVVRHLITGGEPRAVVVAPRIQEYAVLEDAVAAVALDEQGRASVLISRGGDRTEALALPGVGEVSRLRGSAESGHVGFVFTGAGETGAAYTSVLFLYDTDDPSVSAAPVESTDGSPLQVTDWEFVPGTAYLVAHAFDGAVYMIDATRAAPTRLLGQHNSLAGFIPGTTSLLVQDSEGVNILDLTTGSVELLRRAVVDEIVHVPSAMLDVHTTVDKDEAPRPSGMPQASVTVSDAEGERTIFRAPDDGSRIRDVCVSPNAAFLAVEIVPPETESDLYPTLSAWAGMRVEIVDAVSGASVATLPGFRPQWCR